VFPSTNTARVLCAPIITAGLANPATAETAVRVRLYDYARVSRSVLETAKTQASAILRQAGVRVQWVRCSLREGDNSGNAACRLSSTAMDLELRILDRAMAKRAPTTQYCLGYAWLAPGSNSIAAVFYNRAIDLEKGNLATRSDILGAIMAHEIGHLLLEQASHAETGIMRARWGDDDLRLIAKGRMQFTTEQGRLIVEKVSRRSGRSGE
jgi:hypothetical protein